MRFRFVITILAGLILAACSPGPLLAPTAGPPAAPANIPARPATLVAAPALVTPNASSSPSPAEPTRFPTMTAAPASPTSTGAPIRATALAGLPAPREAYRAWAVAPSGDVYMLDAGGAVHQFSPDLQRPLASGGNPFGVKDIGRGYLAVSDEFIVLVSAAVTRTIVLDRPSSRVRADFPGAGPLALDGSKRMYLLYENAVWSYKLDDLSRPPVPVTTWPVDTFTPRPRNLAIDQPSRQLLVTLEDVSASPPHRQQWYQAYNLDSLQPTVRFGGGLGQLTPASEGMAGIVAGLAAKNGPLGSKVVVFDREGKELRAAQQFEGQPVADPAGDYVYVLRERGLWVLRGSDLGLVAFRPYVGSRPLDLLLSPDGSKLYLVGNGALEVLDTAAVRAAGVARLEGVPLWFLLDVDQPEAMRPRFFPARGAPDVAFAQAGGYGETWRSDDHGRSWAMLPGMVYPNFRYAPHLSISPDFASDETLVAVIFGQAEQFARSNDRGDTWTTYDPPFAFVSERDGNREIYTADQGKPGSGEAQNLVRRTNSSAAEENPAWSPAWTRIALQSNRNGNWDIYTIRADCDPSAPDAAKLCDERRITDDGAADMLPAWSPDGRWIAFVSTRSGQAEIWIAAAAGGPATRLTTSGSGAWRPAWLPDSERILFTATQANGSNDIFMGRIAEGPDGGLSMPQVQAVVNGPADERDASIAREYFVYLSNESLVYRTYRRYNYDMGSSFPTTAGSQPEGHPSVLDDGEATVLLTLERNGQTGIYRATSNGYEAFVVGQGFNGQPAAGPVPWQPSADASKESFRVWQMQK